MSLKPLAIGSLTVDFPVVLAALSGFSDLSYRLICRSLGAPFASTEVMSDRQLLTGGRFLNRMARSTDDDHPIAGQIMGNDPKIMARAAAILRDHGFDAVDLNFACPVRKVLSRRRGGHLLTQPKLALEIVRAVREAVPDRPLMIKLRKSFARTEAPGDEAFWEIARGAFELGADALTLHGRSVEQKYSGPADWEFLKAARRAFPGRTLIGSGDVRSAADALRLIEETGMDGASAARGAIGNPWIFRQARDLAAGRAPYEPGLVEQKEVIQRHYALARELHGERRGLGVMRHIGIAYAKVHPQPKRARMAFAAVKTERDWEATLAELYG